MPEVQARPNAGYMWQLNLRYGYLWSQGEAESINQHENQYKGLFKKITPDSCSEGAA